MQESMAGPVEEQPNANAFHHSLDFLGSSVYRPRTRTQGVYCLLAIIVQKPM